jgi:exosortase A
MPSTLSEPSAAPWSRSAPAILWAVGLGTLTLLFWRDGIVHLVGVYLSSPTWQHGLLVPLISAGLMRAGWQPTAASRFWPPGLLVLGGVSAAYAFGTVFELRLVQHAAIAAQLAAIAITAGGPEFAVRHRFALAYLIFMVPFGEAIVPALQGITATGIMALLSLTDILAIRDGLLIRTEAGDFLVAEACAGLRFLIATIAAGVLLTHLLHRDWRRQAAFVALCFLVPIIANILRAAGTVMVASWTDMQVAVGFDHLLYGWAFFAVVLLLLIGIGWAMAEPDAPQRPTPARMHRRPIPVWALSVAALFVVLAGLA